METYVFDGKRLSFLTEITENIKVNPETGVLTCNNVVLGQVGPLKYKGSEIGKLENEIILHRTEESLFDEASIETLIGASAIWLHQLDENGKVIKITSKNFKKYEVGTVVKAWRDGNFLMGQLVIKDEASVEKVLDGKRGVSLGYVSKYKKIGPNEYEQYNVRYDHLALGVKPRAESAYIYDGMLEEKKVGVKGMNLLDWLFSKGQVKSIKMEDDTEVSVGDSKYITERNFESKTTETYDTDTDERTEVNQTTTTVVSKKVDEEETKETNVGDGNSQENPNEEKGDELVMDEKYFADGFAEVNGLPDGFYKRTRTKELEKQYADFKGIEYVEAKDNSAINDIKVGDGEKEEVKKAPKKINWRAEEAKRSAYYRNLNPMQHGDYRKGVVFLESQVADSESIALEVISNLKEAQ